MSDRDGPQSTGVSAYCPLEIERVCEDLFGSQFQGQLVFQEDVNAPTIGEWAEAVSGRTRHIRSGVLDWTLHRDRQLSEAASGAISEADRVLVSSISIWEIGIKVARGGLSIPLTVIGSTLSAWSGARVEVLPVDTETWLANLDLPWDWPGPCRPHHRSDRRGERLPTGDVRQGHEELLPPGGVVTHKEVNHSTAVGYNYLIDLAIESCLTGHHASFRQHNDQGIQEHTQH